MAKKSFLEKAPDKRANKIKAVIKGAMFPLLLLFAWEFAARNELVDVLFLPAPSEIFLTLSSMLMDGTLSDNLLASLSRLAYGFCLAAFLAVPAGILVGKTKSFSEWVNPTLSFLQHIPPIAWIPLFILWLGIDEASKVAVITYASFFPIFLNTVHGVKSVDPKLVEVAKSFMLTSGQMIRRVYVPSAIMSIFVGLRLGLSNCWRALVGAELIAASSGIGALITQGRQYSQPDVIFVGILTIGIAGLLIDGILLKIEASLMPWK